MRNIKAWIEAMRLRTLPVSVAGVLMAVGFNIGDGTFDALAAISCMVFAILCQIASNFANEYYDYRAGRDRAGREGPRRGVTEGDLSPSSMKRATYATLVIAALVGLSLAFRSGWWLIGAGALIGIGALAYSTGPYPLSTHCLGEVAVLFFFGIVPVNLTYYVQALEWSAEVLAASVAIGLMGANVLVVNNYRDIDDDKAVGKHTLATRFGRRFSRILYLANAIVAVALTFALWLGMPSGFIAVPAAYLGGAVGISLKMRSLQGRELTPLLALTSVLMALYALFFLIANTL